MTDPVADMLTRVRNAYLAEHESVPVPYSKLKEGVVKLLVEAGYLSRYKVEGEGSKKTLVLPLLYLDGRPAINNVEKVSKPGRRVYVKKTAIPRPLSGYGLVIVSTSRGLMSGDEARKQKLGGEIICKVW